MIGIQTHGVTHKTITIPKKIPKNGSFCFCIICGCISNFLLRNILFCQDGCVVQAKFTESSIW